MSDKQKIGKLETYVNRNGFPMIRRCQNCIFWKSDNSAQKIGLCTFKPLFFAFTLEPTVYPMTKDFCLCENHKFHNEEKLSQVCEKTTLSEVVRPFDFGEKN